MVSELEVFDVQLFGLHSTDLFKNHMNLEAVILHQGETSHIHGGQMLYSTVTAGLTVFLFLPLLEKMV